MKNIQLMFLFCLFIVCGCNQKEPQTSDKTVRISTETPASLAQISKKNILFFGNSLTAAYGLDDVAKGFVSLTQERIDSLNLAYHCINAGLSGETTAGGNSRIDWVIDQQPVDVFMLELGGNDALRGLPPAESEKNLQSIIDKVKKKYPSVKIVLAGMEAPRNMGGKYISDFHNIYANLAKRNKVTLIPFILENVGGIASLNQKDGIHPTPEGNKIIVETIWATLKPLL